MHARPQPSTLDGYDVDASVELRLNALLYANHWEAQRQHLFLNALEEQQMRLMRRPISTQRAFTLFGLLLGGLPSAAIFIKIFSGLFIYSTSVPGLFLLLLFMNAVCWLAGAFLGSKLSGMITTVERDSWALMFLESLIIGLIWGAGAGAAGGLAAWGIGAIFGAIYAIQVGMVGFGLFVPLHRLLARGGMIDARHFWPLACGVVMIITAFILGL